MPLTIQLLVGGSGKPSTYNPRTGSPLVYNPEWWNDYAGRQYGANCYAYALNLTSIGQNGRDVYQPGYTQRKSIKSYMLEVELSDAGKYMTDEMKYHKAIENAAMDDAAALGINFESIEADALMDPGNYKVVLLIGDQDDYHWIRQNLDGTWSHKRGTTEVTNLDALGNVIYDPDEADFNYGDQGNGQNYKVVGYYAVSPANTYNGNPPQ